MTLRAEVASTAPRPGAVRARWSRVRVPVEAAAGPSRHLCKAPSAMDPAPTARGSAERGPVRVPVASGAFGCRGWLHWRRRPPGRDRGPGEGDGERDGTGQDIVPHSRVAEAENEKNCSVGGRGEYKKLLPLQSEVPVAQACRSSICKGTLTVQTQGRWCAGVRALQRSR